MEIGMNALNYFDTMARAQKGYSRLLEPLCRKWDLTRNEMDVLLFLANNPEFDRAVDIVNNRGLSKSHVSLSINNLEKKGLLRREEDPDDRRTIRLHLLPKSREITDAGQEAQRRFFTFLHQGVTQEQIELMSAFVQKVGENVRNIEEIF